MAKPKRKEVASSAKDATPKAPRTSSRTTSGDAGGPLLIVGAAPTNDSGGSSHYGNAYRQGREALDRLSWGRDYSDWKLVAAALDTARRGHGHRRREPADREDLQQGVR